MREKIYVTVPAGRDSKEPGIVLRGEFECPSIGEFYPTFEKVSTMVANGRATVHRGDPPVRGYVAPETATKPPAAPAKRKAAAIKKGHDDSG